MSIAPHLGSTKSDYETGPFHSDLSRGPVMSIAPHLGRTKPDYETGPFHSGLVRGGEVRQLRQRAVLQACQDASWSWTVLRNGCNVNIELFNQCLARTYIHNESQLHRPNSRIDRHAFGLIHWSRRLRGVKLTWETVKLDLQQLTEVELCTGRDAAHRSAAGLTTSIIQVTSVRHSVGV
uniref:Uncharacterized protein n=1 Tax=Timema cristinae TaxID=61476 RepID=A0A7R9CMH2_TIMCR|nr:unnamed protein product [Timema cristinae]